MGINYIFSIYVGNWNEQYEAAVIDEAGRWKQLIHATLSGIAPAIVILLILRLGQVMNIPS